MNIYDVMSEPVRTCTPETWLAHAARMMRDSNYGVLPVTDWDGRVMGILTDRDICLAIASSNRSPRAIAVREVMTKKVIFLRGDDEVRIGLNTLKHARVRRAPVLDAAGRLIGLVSVDDLVVRGMEAGVVDAPAIVSMLGALCERRLMRRQAKSAA